MKIIDKLFKKGVGLTPLAAKCSVPLMVLLVAFLFSSSDIAAQQSDKNLTQATYEDVQSAIKDQLFDVRLEARNSSPDGDEVAQYLIEYFNLVLDKFTLTADIEYAFIQSAEVFQDGSSSFKESGFYETLFSDASQRPGASQEPALTLSGDESTGLEDQLNAEFVDLVEAIDLSAASSYAEQLNNAFGYLQSIR